MPPINPQDLTEVLAATSQLWDELRGQHLFLTGGTGFFGCWLVESFLHANRTLALDARLTVLTRDSLRFLDKLPHLRAEPALTLLAGDVRNFAFPAGTYSHIIHAATEASAQQLAEHPHQMLSTILAGTERVLSFAVAVGTRKLLLTSSGAVYGPQPASVSHIPESFPGAPDPLLPSSVYGEGKRASELMAALAAQTGLEVKIARCYAFLGPHLPLDTHFAIGNFLRDAMAGRPIEIASDGTSLRSYLYASDLVTWLWTMLFRAPSLRAYNVGSEEAISIRALAETVAHTLHPDAPSQVKVGRTADPSTPPHRYIPSTQRARNELALQQKVTLEEALRRTAAWHRLK